MITYYEKNIKQTSGGFDVELNSFLEKIKEGTWEDKVNKIRAEKDKVTRQKLKSNLPYVTISGTFNNRSLKGLKAHSGFICIDIDNIDNIELLEEQLKKDSYIYSFYRSVSGYGLAVIIKINGSKHNESFLALQEYFTQKYFTVIDASCSDVSRARYISYDPNLYLNPKAKKWTKARKPLAKKIPQVIYHNDDIGDTVRKICERGLDITGDYKQWLSICYSIAGTCGEDGRDYFHAISRFSPTYKEKVTDRQFTECLKRENQNKSKYANISTFFYFAKQAGIETFSKETLTASSVASQSKKANKDKEQTLKELQEIHNIPEDKSKQIIDQVYDSNIDVKKDNELPLIDKIEAFLRGNYPMRKNKITRNLEKQDGSKYEDADLRDIWRNAVKQVDEGVKTWYIENIITSHFYESYSPFEEFFEKYKDRKPTGNIKKLAECLNSDTGKIQRLDFCEYFIRKWFVGLISTMMEDDVSPLLLVLTGQRQGTGKTHFFRHLLPKELRPYQAKSKLDEGKDSEILMCKKILILDDEYGGKSKQDAKRLKDLISTDIFTIREPYGRASVDMRRIATLCGTSNETEVLNDPTGNRRVIPIEIKNLINHDLYNSIDKVDLIIEAYNLWKDGFDWQLLNKDIDLLNQATINFEAVSPEKELILKHFFLPKEFPKKEITLLTTTEILTEFQAASGLRHLTPRKIGLEMKKIGFEQKSMRRNGGSTQRYWKVIFEKDLTAFDKDDYDSRNTNQADDSSDEVPF